MVMQVWGVGIGTPEIYLPFAIPVWHRRKMDEWSGNTPLAHKAAQ